ncbi:MAG: DUF4123 domain-containing protein [Bacteroidota bacterium]
MQGANLILIDAAVTGHTIGEGKALNEQFVSLYRGLDDEDIEQVGPYLFSFSAGSAFAHWVIDRVWGGRTGVLIKSSAGLEECLLHFQQHLFKKDGRGKDQYFRFYDPRVLKTYLPACDKNELAGFFGPVEKFIMEGESSEEAVEYGLLSGILQRHIL